MFSSLWWPLEIDELVQSVKVISWSLPISCTGPLSLSNILNTNNWQRIDKAIAMHYRAAEKYDQKKPTLTNYFSLYFHLKALKFCTYRYINSNRNKVKYWMNIFKKSGRGPKESVGYHFKPVISQVQAQSSAVRVFFKFLSMDICCWSGVCQLRTNRPCQKFQFCSAGRDQRSLWPGIYVWGKYWRFLRN